MHSIRLRLLVALIGVVVVAVASVALFASRISASELRRFIERDSERNRVLITSVIDTVNAGVAEPLDQATITSISQKVEERVIVTDGTGKVIADSLGTLNGQAIPCDWSEPAVIVTMGEPTCVEAMPGIPARLRLDTSKAAPAISATLKLPVTASEKSGSDILFYGVTSFEKAVPSATINIDTMAAKGMILVRRTQALGRDPIEEGFISAVNGSLLLAAFTAGIAALLLSLLLSRRILQPIQTLTDAARSLARGDLSQRVPITFRDEIGTLTEAFNSMADSLAQVERMRRMLVSDIAHELRTPLTNIRGYLEAIRDDVAQPDPPLIESLYEETLLLTRLVHDLQELALAEAGNLRLVREPTELKDVVASAVRGVQPALTTKELRVNTALAPDLPLLALDANRIRQVFNNLLNNAITHTAPGGAIYISAHSDDEQVTVRISDNGAGIAAEHLPYIFERFYRADTSRARITGGAGLGLAIVKQIIAAHGGLIWAKSTLGEGTTFIFTLPQVNIQKQAHAKSRLHPQITQISQMEETQSV